MPAISPPLLLNTLVIRNITDANSTDEVLQVVCAWPVSGQYGPGSRVLYYCLIAASIFARKADWLRNACLAGALLFPAVAALHGIVLAAVHVNGAVDMDVYGAFQLCSIGILAAPVVVRLSRTYFYDPGRNIIFLWTILILVGLLSLTVEFFRINTSECPHDDAGNPISPNPGLFTFNTNCSLTCSTTGPVSPIRGGSANNIYVIPAPDKLTFGTATLFSAACCVPAILSLVSMWNKILKINWRTRFGDKEGSENTDRIIEGTNGATDEKMKRVNGMIRLFMSAVEIPVFGAAVFTILLCGERNFFSVQVSYQTEPITSIGQWAPIVGTGLAIIGSLYLLLAESVQDGAAPHASKHRCTCSIHEDGTGSLNESSHTVVSADASEDPQSILNDGEEYSNEIAATTAGSSKHPDLGKRRQVAKALASISSYVGTARRELFDDSEFKSGLALNFPEVPGEINRNRALPRIRKQYNNRPASFTGSVGSGLGDEGSSATARATSPTTPRRADAGFFLSERTSFELHKSSTLSSAGLTRGRQRKRRDTLEVPAPTRYGHTPHSLSTSSLTSNITVPASPSSPTIVVSSDISPPPPVHTPVSNPPASSPQEESTSTP